MALQRMPGCDPRSAEFREMRTVVRPACQEHMLTQPVAQMQYRVLPAALPVYSVLILDYGVAYFTVVVC